MTKKELIEALEPYKDDTPIVLNAHEWPLLNRIKIVPINAKHIGYGHYIMDKHGDTIPMIEVM